jgi:hypothetical protein
MLKLSDYQKSLLIATRRWQLNLAPCECRREGWDHLKVVRLYRQPVPRAFIEWDCPRSLQTNVHDEEKRLESYELILRDHYSLKESIPSMHPPPPFIFWLLNGTKVEVKIVENDPEWDTPILRLSSTSGTRAIDGNWRLASDQRHIRLTRFGLEQADMLLKSKYSHKTFEWSPPAGTVGTKEIMSSPRFQKSGKNPPRATIQEWQNNSPPPSRTSARGTGESYYPEDWVVERIANWNPRSIRRRP